MSLSGINGMIELVGGVLIVLGLFTRPVAFILAGERCCPSAAQARRSETCSCARTCSMQARRRAGLRSFPGRPPAE
jgi:hypothetical protein